CCSAPTTLLHSFPTRRSSDLDTSTISGNSGGVGIGVGIGTGGNGAAGSLGVALAINDIENEVKAYIDSSQVTAAGSVSVAASERSEEHTSELQSPDHLVCRLL